VRHRLPPALRLRSFALLWTSSLTNGVAAQMMQVAIGWQVYSIHKSTLDLGLVGLAEFVPLPLLALPAGQLADRVSRRAITAASLVLDVGIAVFLLVVTIHGANALWPFLAVGAMAGVASVVGNPATRALTPDLVPPEILQNAVTLRNLAGQIGVVAGPALGGIVFAVEPVAVYAVAAALFVVALLAILSLPRQERQLSQPPPDFDSLVAGIRFIVRTKMLLGAIALDLFGVLLGDSIALAPAFAQSILHIGPIGLGMLRVAPSVGALAAGLMLTRKPLQRAAGPTMLAVIASFGVGMIVFGLSKSLPLSLAALAFTGFVDMISVNIRATVLAVVTPRELQGRVNAVEWVFISASNELGAFEAGGVAALIGVVPAVVAGGGVMIGIAAIWRRVFPALSTMGRLDELETAPV
jgi:Transmembrane secretion effector